jgi:hypothetical protein
MSEWRYTPQGIFRHAVDSADAACGLTRLRSEDWLGTGCQEKYEQVASIPSCPRCVVKVGAAVVAAMTARAAEAVAV